MDRDEFAGLVHQLEAESENSPAAFRTKVLLLSVAAYVFLFVLLAGIAVAIGWTAHWAHQHNRTRHLVMAGIFALMMLPVFYVVLRVFFMRLSAPEGREITRADAPRLFEVLDKMRRRLKGPEIHHVLIDTEYNAAISQRPRFGLFGGHTNYLMLGLPYLIGTPPKEMLATVAHEYGHLCGNHGKTGAWVYRQRRTFIALYQQLDASQETSWVHAAMYGLLRRFMPHYDAYTFVLSRQQEFEADKTATDLAGAQHNATGLIRDTLLGRWIHDEFWPRFYRQSDQHVAPTFYPYASMRTAFVASHADWATQPRLSAAWRENSDAVDTHPCLRERVEAMGHTAKLPPAAEQTAADVLLCGFTKTLVDEFDQDWWKREKNEWQSRFQYVKRSKQELEALSTRSIESLQLHELQQFALLKAEFDSPQAAKPVLEYLLAKPGGPFPKPAYFYGRILLDEKNDRGLEYLEITAKSDRNSIDKISELGYYYLLEKQGERAAEAWWDKIMGLAEQ